MRRPSLPLPPRRKQCGHRRIAATYSQGRLDREGGLPLKHTSFAGARWKAGENSGSLNDAGRRTPSKFYRERMGLVQLERWHRGPRRGACWETPRTFRRELRALWHHLLDCCGGVCAVYVWPRRRNRMVLSWDGDTREGTTTGRHLGASPAGLRGQVPGRSWTNCRGDGVYDAHVGTRR